MGHRTEATADTAVAHTAWLTVFGARQNNLKNIDVRIPLGRFVCITGVSGSGKSSLVNDILREALVRDLNGATDVHPGVHERIEGLEHLDKVIDIDQSPIGRTPRSNPATYIKIFDEIRDLFARLPDSKVRGYKPGRFSFNVPAQARGKKQTGGGRCEACEGNGSNRMEMDFLADVWVTCPVCNGKRFSRETLHVLYKGKSISDVLEMDVQQALGHFENVPKIAQMLQTLHEVGLDYIKIGQSSTTLSGGEAQRIKLARELVKRSTGRTLYLLDEPTTGLHFDDIKKLLAVLHRFVDAGNTVVVIEHNLDVIKTADWIIDLGPEGGEAGGRIVAAGTPEVVARSSESHTGVSLRGVLDVRSTSPVGAKGSRVKGPTARRNKLEAQAVGIRPLGRSDSARKGSASLRGLRLPAHDGLDRITVVGAKQHNLKDITVEIPRGATTVCCGPSGSGKSSFAIDTLYAEGQRKYVESLSAYARQFLSRLQPPKVDHVFGLSPAICIEQRATGASPRSTVGTVTEIHDYMRILWARIGQPYCPQCKVPINTQTSDEIVERILDMAEGRKIILLAPAAPTGQETYEQLFRRERNNGLARVRVDGSIHSLDEPIPIDTRREHKIELVIDRLSVRRSQTGRLADSVEQALVVGNGVLVVQAEEVEGVQLPGGRITNSKDPQSAGLGKGGPVVSGDVRPPRSTRGLHPAVRSESEFRFSLHRSCGHCGRGFEELNPHHFSFNSRLGWCDACEGLGTQKGASPTAIVLHPALSILEGALAGWNVVQPGSMLHAFLRALADQVGFDLARPWNQLTESQRQAVLQGCGEDWIEIQPEDESAPNLWASVHLPTRRPAPAAGLGSQGVRFKWRGFFPAIHRATRVSVQYRKKLEDLATDVPCEACAGGRLRPDSNAVRVHDATLHEVTSWPLKQALDWFLELKLDTRRKKISGDLVHEITSRLSFLVEVGLDYLSLSRTAATLSGGESQRIQLASQIGSGLSGVLYILDEPTIGLHPRDNLRLIGALHRLRNLGNTLLVVEHDREVIGSADYVLDFGPGAGSEGGTITAAAPPTKIRAQRNSLTGQYLSNSLAIPVPSNRRPVPPIDPVLLRHDLAIDTETQMEAMDSRRMVSAQAGPSGREPAQRTRFDVQWLVVHGARENNLKEIDVAFPLGRFTCVTGVSGSGKSTLVSSILYNALAVRLHRARLVPGGHESLTGLEAIDKVINVDQAPIGNSPTSNPATYTGVFDGIRELWTTLSLSKMRGYTANRFSFNRPGGRCEACQGMGQKCIEMHFLPDVWVECESCKGTRYLAETLDVRFHGHSIADVLNLRVQDALGVFQNVPSVRRILQTLDDVGLGYLQLGQPAPTLSGGEAQRVKLAAELSRPSTGKTLYILDEPTTGLHFDDIKKLLIVVHRLVDLGNTCICIEHNLDVIKTADWVIDLGPEAGERGGVVVAEGPPETIATASNSHTGMALKSVLNAGPVAQREVFNPSSGVLGISGADSGQPSKSRAGNRRRKSLAGPGLSPQNDVDEVKMPWERDGRTWHTVEHVDANGALVEWDPKLLEWLVDAVERAGKFTPADWNHRTRIEVSSGSGRPWFCHILTRSKDLIQVAFRVRQSTFRQKTLRSALGIKTLDERTDLPIYGRWERVGVRAIHVGSPYQPGWDEVRLYLRDFQDVDRKAFGAFLKSAVGSYFQQIETTLADPKKGEPWKTDGKQWHLSQRSIHKRHVVEWRPDALLALIGRLKSMQPDLEFDWATRTGVKFTVPGEKSAAGKIVTNIGRGLRVSLRAPASGLTPTMIDRLGEDAEIKPCGGEDWLSFWVRTLHQNDTRQFRDVWRRCRPAGVVSEVQST